MNAPRSASPSTTSTRSGSPKTTSAEPRSACTALRTSSRWLSDASAPIRTDVVGGVADGDLRQSRRDRLGDLAGDAGGHDHAPDRGALLAGLDRHLGDHALDEQVELRVARGDVGAEHGAVQRVGLDPELDAAVEHRRVLPQVGAGMRGAGERHRVLRPELLEQAGRAAAQQLQGSVGEQAGLEDPAYDELGEVRRLAGRLHDRGQAGQERGRELLEHPPDREVERVDLHRDAGPRGVDVLAEEGALAAEPLEPPVEVDGVVGQLTGALAGDAEHRADAAVDVDHRVPLGGAGAVRQLVELVLDLGQVLRHRLEQARALVEGQRPDRRTADRPGVVGHRTQVDPGRRDPGHLLAGRRVQQRLTLVVGREPAAAT